MALPPPPADAFQPRPLPLGNDLAGPATDAPAAKTILVPDGPHGHGGELGVASPPPPAARSELEEEARRLLKPGLTPRQRRRRNVIVASLSASGALLVLAALSWAQVLPAALGFHFACLAILAALGPPGFHAHHEQKRIRGLEQHFPDFLRDVASSHKGGLTLHQAAAIAARGSYGELTPDVRKMADQLAWNLSFSDALTRFAQRVDTPLVQRAVSLILQADRSGGATSDVLLAAARDAREIKTLEVERRSTMGLYTIVVYITFLVFLAVTAILYARFVPQIIATSTAVQGLQTSAAVAGIASQSLTLQEYRLFYFVAALVQAVGDGIVAGVLGSGRIVYGLRHSFAMVLMAYLAFAFLL